MPNWAGWIRQVNSPRLGDEKTEAAGEQVDFPQNAWQQ